MEIKVSKLFLREIEYQIEIEKLKNDIECCDDYSARKAFKAIDENRFGFINDANLKVFLRKMGHQSIN